MPPMLELGNSIYQIDVHDQGTPERTSCYLIVGERTALIETGPAPGSVYLKEAFRELGLLPHQVDYIIVTHIHLDHSGGAGVMAVELPRAKILVHPRGARHLIDPSRLIAGAKAVYGERFEGFFGDILPVPEERVYSPGDGETLDLGRGRVLTFFHTLGHARHHFVVYDQSSQGVFSGDALGVRYQALSGLAGYDFTLPSTPPSEFDPAAATETIDRMLGLPLEQIYFTHFGRAEGAPAILSRYRKLLAAFEETGRRVTASGGGAGEIEAALWDLVMSELSAHGVKDREHPAIKPLDLDMELNAAGIAYYLFSGARHLTY